MVGAAIRYPLSLPFREPSRIGVVAVSLEIVPHGAIGVIAKPWLKKIKRGRNLRETFLCEVPLSDLDLEVSDA